MKKIDSMKMGGKCPVCSGDVKYSWSEEEIPYFGNIMITVLECDCGWKSTEVISLEEHEPYHCELALSRDTLNTRIIKGSTGSIKIPELDTEISPKGSSEGYVTNGEGVLNRILEAAGNKEGSGEIKKAIADIKDGKRTVTLIIDDPKGNSFIVKSGK